MGSKIKASSTLAANTFLKRTVWSTPQGTGEGKVFCGRCKYFADHHARVSELTDIPVGVNSHTEMTFGACQNLKIWAAVGRDRPPMTRSYYVCNYFEKKEKENG